MRFRVFRCLLLSQNRDQTSTRLQRRNRKPLVEGLESRQLLSGLNPNAQAILAQHPIAAKQIPTTTTSTATIQRVVLQPRLGRVLIQFRNALGGIDANALSTGVSLTRIQSPRFPIRLTLVGTPQVLPDVYEPIPGPPDGPVVGGPLLQTVGAVFESGRALPRGSYLLTVDSNVARDVNGQPLDGEFNGNFPSGDARPGGNFRAILSTNNFYSYLPTPIGGFFAPGNRLPSVQGGRPGSLLH